MISLTGSEFIIFAYQKSWYERQGRTVWRSCDHIKPGMSQEEVWNVVNETGEPHGSWQGHHMLGFWGRTGSCSVSLDPSEGRVAKSEYSESTGVIVRVE